MYTGALSPTQNHYLTVEVWMFWNEKTTLDFVVKMWMVANDQNAWTCVTHDE